MSDFGQVTRIERSDTVGGQVIYRTKSYDASGRETFRFLSQYHGRHHDDLRCAQSRSSAQHRMARA